MRFKTSAIQQNIKTVTNMESDFVYLDVKENKMYLSSENQALQLQVDFEEVTDEEVFVISKADFLHIATFAEEIELKSDYTFKAGNSKGKFEQNENYVEVLDSIKVMFTQSAGYFVLFDVDEKIMNLLTRGGIFVRPEDTKVQCQNLNIQQGYVFSSSVFRIYVNTFPIEADGIIHADVLKFILQLGEGTSVKKNNDSFLLEKEGIALYFSSLRSVDFLPVLSEKFQEKYKAVFGTTKITFALKELQSKLEFISFYARKNPSALTFLNIEDERVTLSVNKTSDVSVDVDSIEYIEKSDKEFQLPFNSITMLEIISKLGKGIDKVTLYASKDNDNSKLFVLSFGETENVILTKINI